MNKAKEVQAFSGNFEIVNQTPLKKNHRSNAKQQYNHPYEKLNQLHRETFLLENGKVDRVPSN